MNPWHVGKYHCRNCRQVSNYGVMRCTNCGSRSLGLIVRVYPEGSFATIPVSQCRGVSNRDVIHTLVTSGQLPLRG